MHGVKVIPNDSLDTNTPQTPGMNRAAAINYARVGAQKLWPAPSASAPTRKPALIITARWKASSILCGGARPDAVGRSTRICR